ncbi:MAG TPA: hypothetical protein VMV48_02815 [Gallionellaceae bacterium]|nr:hypothetical protein [Gallionellaceae bacterium]
MDDNLLIRNSLRLALSDNFIVHLTENRSQAIELLRSMSPTAVGTG